jgi:hypothetical protein
MSVHVLPPRAVKNAKGTPERRYVYTLRDGEKIKATSTARGYVEWDGAERMWTFYEFVDPAKGDTTPLAPVPSARAAVMAEAIRLAVGED